MENLELLLGSGEATLSRFPDERARQKRLQLGEGVWKTEKVGSLAHEHNHRDARGVPEVV
jgi:hypothetical protein